MRRRLACHVVLGAVLASACGGGADPAAVTSTPSPVPSSTTASAPSPSPSPPPSGIYDPSATLEVAVGSLPRGVLVHDGSVWVAASRSSQLVGVDPAALTVQAVIETGPRPITPVEVEGQFWLSVLGAGEGAVGRSVVRIDTEAGRVDRTVELPVFHNIAGAAGALWVLDGEDGLQRVDLATGAVTDVIPIGSGTQALHADDRSVWGVREDGTAWRVDTGSRTVTAEIPVGSDVPGRSWVTIVDDEVWMAIGGAVHVLDALTGESIGRVAVDGLEGTTGLAPDGGSLWLAGTVRPPDRATAEGVIVRIDRSDRSVTDRYPAGTQPGGLAVTDGTLWFADQDRGVLVRLDP